MSMLGQSVGADDVGETVGSFASYEAAQKAVTALIEAEVPPRDIAIVGTGLRSVERVTGKLGMGSAVRSGLINGLFFGVFASAVMTIANPSAAIPAVVYFGTFLICFAVGMLMSYLSYLIVRRRRVFASAMGVVADHYEIAVKPTSIHKAREVLSHEKLVRPKAAPTVIDTNPPKYGERLPSYGQPTQGEGTQHQSPQA